MSLFQVNFREAFRSLWGARQRSLLALIGIVIGIGSVIGMVSIGNIVQQQVLGQFRDMGIDIVTIRKGDGGGSKRRIQHGAPGAIARGEPKHPGNRPVREQGSTEFSQGRQKIFMEQMGVTATFFDLNKLHFLEGRAISDLDQNRYFCVVGSELATFLRNNRGPGSGQPDLRSTAGPIPLSAFWTRRPKEGSDPHGINRAMIVPITTSLRAFNNAEIRTIMAKVSPDVPFPRIKTDIQDYFRKKAGGMQVEVVSAEELIENMKKQMQMFSLLLGAIGSISLIVGGIGVMNVMLISVSERRSEIGLRRALGAQQSDIQSQFLIESVILCLTGGIIGVVLGIGVSYLFASFSKWQFIMSFWAIALGFGVSTVVGVFCGFYPARTAARLDPIKALRS